MAAFACRQHVPIKHPVISHVRRTWKVSTLPGMQAALDFIGFPQAVREDLLPQYHNRPVLSTHRLMHFLYNCCCRWWQPCIVITHQRCPRVCSPCTSVHVNVCVWLMSLLPGWPDASCRLSQQRALHPTQDTAINNRGGWHSRHCPAGSTCECTAAHVWHTHLTHAHTHTLCYPLRHSFCHSLPLPHWAVPQGHTPNLCRWL